MISQEGLKKILDYDSETGDFVRRVARSGCRKSSIAGYKHSSGYILIGANGKQYFAHRLAWLYIYGHWPPDQIDHIDHDRGNNRIANLRAVGRKENARNQTMYANNSSGVTGVNWHKQDEKWRARIYIDGKDIFLGGFDKIAAAAAARQQADIKYGYHPNHGLSLKAG